jgi:DNA-binding FrmR family transcriptional regulator
MIDEKKVKRLSEIQAKIEKAKSRKARAEGVLETLEKRMKEDFECADVDELRAKRKTLSGQIDKLSERFDKAMADLEEAAPWDEL